MNEFTLRAPVIITARCTASGISGVLRPAQIKQMS